MARLPIKLQHTRAADCKVEAMGPSTLRVALSTLANGWTISSMVRAATPTKMGACTLENLCFQRATFWLPSVLSLGVSADLLRCSIHFLQLCSFLVVLSHCLVVCSVFPSFARCSCHGDQGKVRITRFLQQGNIQHQGHRAAPEVRGT